MKLYAPVPRQDAIEAAALPHVASYVPARLLVLDNGRAAGQPLLAAMTASLGQSVRYTSVDKLMVVSGSPLDLVTEAAKQFDAVVVGVGD